MSLVAGITTHDPARLPMILKDPETQARAMRKLPVINETASDLRPWAMTGASNWCSVCV